ncbi:hypothetical protein BKA80DRAFT_285303 [Phyllosticta citrichinensis]
MRNSPFSISISLMLILNLLTLAALPPSQATHLALSPRQVFCALTGESTSVDCAACLGPGALYCGRTGCFDPSQSQSCCADGSACSGGDDCCGDVVGFCFFVSPYEHKISPSLLSVQREARPVLTAAAGYLGSRRSRVVRWAGDDDDFDDRGNEEGDAIEIDRRCVHHGQLDLRPV